MSKIKDMILGVIILLVIITTIEPGIAGSDATHPFGFDINYRMISTVNMTTPTSTGVFLAWTNSVAGSSRVYYGLNETNVSNYINGGGWSIWDNNTINPLIRITGLTANTTYYYKPQVWTGGTPDNSIPVKSFRTLKPGVYVKPAEAIVSPTGWMNSPANFRTINITAAPLNNNGRYIEGLSLEARIYDKFGNEVGRISLIGEGPYYNNFVLPDYSNEGGYFVNITGYPDAEKIRGEFSVLRWSCVNCHSSGGENYPSIFDASVVHSVHFDTRDINVTPAEHGETMTSTDRCDDCHNNMIPSWVPHPSSTRTQCVNCHKAPSGGNPVLTCDKCHNDRTTGNDVLSQRYGVDIHKTQICNNCHGNLSSINSTPTCTTCHPRTGSATIPALISDKSHTESKTVDCGLCHNNEHDIKDLALDDNTCYICHSGITHAGNYQCTECHGTDPHNITSAGGEACIECHGTDYPGANPMAKTTLVNISAFNESIHQNINSTQPDITSNDDCWSCHFNKDMSRDNVRGCNYCHANVQQWHGNANITMNWSELW